MSRTIKYQVSGSKLKKQKSDKGTKPTKRAKMIKELENDDYLEQDKVV